MKRWTFPIVAAALPLCLLAEMPPIQSYTVADGLAGDQINRIVADSHGFIWFCTGEGLSRFDGYRFVNFGVADGLPHRNVNALLETRSGEYFAATSAGVCRLSAGRDGKFTTFLPGSNRHQNFINALLEDSEGRIWCATSEGLFEMLKDHHFRPQPLASPANTPDRFQVNDLLEDADHSLWVATRAGVYVLGRDGRVRHITMGRWTENFRKLLLDRSGRIWAGTQDGLVLVRDERTSKDATGVQQIYNGIGDVKQLDVTSLAQGPDGALWAGLSAGIARSIPGSRPDAFRVLTRAQGLIDRQVDAVATDRAGNMWAGTESAGVMKIQATGFTTFREQDGLHTDRIQSVLTDRAGTFLAVTASVPASNWINLFDGGKFRGLALPVFTDRASWGRRKILLQARNGAWWAATNDGFCRYAPGPPEALAGRRPEECYATGFNAYQIFEDSKGRIWASVETVRGTRLLRWDPATNAVSSVAGGEAVDELVGGFAEDRQGNVWMGLSSGSALVRFDGARFERFHPSNRVPPDPIHDMLIDHTGRLWVATAGGLGRIDNPGAPNFQIRFYRPRDGLAGDSVSAIVEDLAGRIYAGTSAGVDRLDPETGRIKHFSTADGLAHGGISAAVRDSSGGLWFGTTQGLSRLSPFPDKSPAVPSVRITEFHIGRERLPLSQIGETRISHANLPPSQNRLQVGFVGFSDEPEANLRYTYKLDGGDSDWQGPGRDHEVNYAELAPGTYRFLVNAINSAGQASASPAEIDFVILPPVWRRWWFETLAFLGAAGLAILAYRRRLQAITARVRLLYEERLDERTRIARELHDTLLQNLAGVSLQLDGVAKQIGPSSAEAASQIQAVRRQVDASFREARQKVQDLRSPMLQGRALPAVLRESVEQIAGGHPVVVRMTVDGQPRASREEIDEAVLRIGQEAVANAVRHARANEIQVLLAYDSRFLRLRVQDDGQGFDLQEAGRLTGHWGLRNMQERAQRIGAQWKIETAAARGTVIETVVSTPEEK
jgi:signal transduction histidine kinase/ligand-binding sensor domain-containing protein